MCSVTYHSAKGSVVSAASMPLGFTSRAIRVHRERLNLSQSQLGEVIGVSGFSVAAWERGELPPTSENIDRMAACFAVTGVALRYPQSSLSSGTVLASASALQEAR